MLRNTLGEPIPTSADEIVHVVQQVGPLAECHLVQPHPDEDDGPFAGWTADIITEDGRQITTGGFESCGDLLDALILAGVNQISNL